MSHHERVTFTQGRDVIEHAVRHLSRVRDALDELRERDDHDERVAMFLDSVEVEQRNLLGAVSRLLEDGAPAALDTYAQYTVELPTEVPPPGDSGSTLGITRWLAEQNGYLQRTFAELAENGGSAAEREVFGALAQQIESHERRLSKAYQRSEDL